MSDLIKVTDRVWCVRQKSFFACSYIVNASDGIVLIDAGMSSDELGPLVLLKGLFGNALPRPVAVDEFVKDNQVIFDDFDVIETPGHTMGHVSYYFRPEKVLFAGDALAVIGERLRFMARPALTKKVSEERKRFVRMLEETQQWPLLG